MHDRVVGLRDVDPIVDDVAGVGDPLAAAHELIVDAVAERVAHAAVIASEANAASHRCGQVLDLLLFDLGHRDDRHDEAHVRDRRIGEGLGGVFDIDLEVVRLEHLGDDVRAELRLMAAPASPDNERFAHPFLHSNSCFSRVRRRGARAAKARAVPAGSISRPLCQRRTRSGTPPSLRAHGRPVLHSRDAAGSERIACAMSARPRMR